MSNLTEILGVIDTEELMDALGVDYRRTSGGSDLQLSQCPWCGDTRGRIYLSRERKLGVCFVADCQRRFNLFSFVKQTLECDGSKTARYLSDFAAAGLPVVSRARPPARILDDWQMPPSIPIPTPEGATHPYLTDRAVLPDTQRAFGLLWCEEGWFNWQDPETGARKGLRFDQRIIHPICDLDGTVKTFVGRGVHPEMEPRYLFPPLLPSAGRYLYGGERLTGYEHLVLGEGPYDAIAIHQAIKDHPDFSNTVASASFGISIGHSDQAGDDQLGRLLKLKAEGLKRVTFLWDGEQKALKAALRDAEVISRHGLAVHVGLLPAGSDPAEVETRVVREAIDRAPRYTQAQAMLWTLSPPYPAD